MAQYIVTGRNQGYPRPPYVDLIPDAPNTVFSATFDTDTEAALIGGGFIAKYPPPVVVEVSAADADDTVPTSVGDGTYEWAAGGGGDGAANAARVLGPFPFAFDDAGLNNGIAFYTPTIGDVLLDVWVEIDTLFDGTTPAADVGTFSGTANGLFSSTWDVLALNGNPDGENGGAGVLSSGQVPPTSLTGLSGGTELSRTVPALFVAAHPLKFVASQNGHAGGTAVDSTAGAGNVYIVVATPALS